MFLDAGDRWEKDTRSKTFGMQVIGECNHDAPQESYL